MPAGHRGPDSRKAVTGAFDTIVDNAKKFSPDATITGVLVQRLAPKGHEVILGMTRYPIFGPLIMFGFGGIFVEVFKDVAFRLGAADPQRCPQHGSQHQGVQAAFRIPR
jgi:acyl-CoA synthetase (NDP forming)